MKIIVPLAGPDFERHDGTVKAEYPLDGQPLLRRTLTSRPWWGRPAAPEDLIFVLRDSPISRRFAERTLNDWFPGSQQVFLSAAAQGAALSALTGLALAAHKDEIVCIDLADILFDPSADILAKLAQPGVGAALPTFTSSQAIFSYVRRDDSGEVIETAEKRVISKEASAGVYFFKSPAVYLRAVAHALESYPNQTWNSLFFVCPLMNGVLAQTLRVIGVPVTGERVIKI